MEKPNYIKLLDGTMLHPSYYYVTSCGIVRRREDGKVIGNTDSWEDPKEFIQNKPIQEDINKVIKSNEEVKTIINHL